MKRCRNIHILISRSLDGDLNPGEIEELRSHLVGCEACRKIARDYGVQRELVAASFSDQPIPIDITAALIALNERKKRGRPLIVGSVGLCAAALALFVVAFPLKKPFLSPPAVILESGNAASMSLPLGSLVYYEEFAGRTVNSQFVKIAPRMTETFGRTDHQAVNSSYYNSPLFNDAPIATYRQTSLSSGSAAQ